MQILYEVYIDASVLWSVSPCFFYPSRCYWYSFDKMMINLVVMAVAIGGNLAVGSKRDTTSWTAGPFDWPSDMTKILYQKCGKYINKNCIATRGVIYKDQAVVALPRYRKIKLLIRVNVFFIGSNKYKTSIQ